MLCAVEPSGDAHGAGLIAALRQQAPGAELFGCGGPLMAAAGVESLFPIEPFSIIGPVGALKAYPAALRSAKLLADAALERRADAAIFIDGWAFSKMAAERMRKAAPDVKLIKYVGPQVWGSRPHRAKTLAGLFDGVLTLFEFEPPWFEKEGVRSKCVGNSIFQAAAERRGDAAAFRRAQGIGDSPLLALLPGSRPGEIDRLLDAFRETVEIVSRAKPDLRVAVSMAPGVEAMLRPRLEGWPGAPVLVGAEARYDLFAAADAALAASGTISTELAISATPMVVGYRMHWATAAWVRRVATIRYASMVNIAADREIIPEFLQERCTPAAMAAALLPLFDDASARAAQLEAFPEALAHLGVGGPPASDVAAATLLDWIAE